MQDEVAGILAARAEQLSRPISIGEGHTRPMLVLEAGAATVGVTLSSVGSVHRQVPISSVPWLPPPWIGLGNVRGAIVALIDLAVAIDAAVPGTTPIDRVVLVEGVGLGVSRVVGVVEHDTLAASEISVLDVHELLGDPRLVVEDPLT